MANKTIRFKAGVIKDETELGAQPYWSNADRIRFVRGLPQKIGGWEAYTAEVLNGVCRGMFAWRDSSSVRRIALGTHKRLYVEEGTALFDITPIRATSSDQLNCFTTVSGSPVVTVTDSSHGAAAGDGVIVAQAAAVGGITPVGAYEIEAVVDANTYLIRHSSAATSSATGGGANTDIQYQISVGRRNGIEGSGYGVGGYGSGTYNTARSSSLILPPRVWSLDRFNANLLACPRNGSIYEWTLNTATPAAVLANAPTNNIGMFVTDELHVVALGAGGAFMTLEWCSQNANTVWTPGVTNTAGVRTLTGGNKILQGMRMRGTNLILCDGSVWTMTFIGGLDVFGFTQQGAGAEGGLSQKCGVVVDGVAYWMGAADFYMFDGVIRPMPRRNDIKQFVYESLEVSQIDKVHACYMSKYREIWFFYPVGQEISRYVKFNLDERCWDPGGLVRTAMIDAGIFPYPVMTDDDGNIWNHEIGFDAGGAAMNDFIKSSPIEISDGNHLMEILHVLPDIKDLSGEIYTKLYTREYAQAAETASEAYPIDSAIEIVDTHESGRQVAIEFGSSQTGADWRLGPVKVDVQPLGQN